MNDIPATTVMKKPRRMARPAPARPEPASATPAVVEEPGEIAGVPAAPATKGAVMTELLSRPGGATIAQLVEVTGWQQHSVRGFMAGTLKKRPGATLISDKTATGRIYRLVASEGAAR
jgi:hypothetical protein